MPDEIVWDAALDEAASIMTGRLGRHTATLTVMGPGRIRMELTGPKGREYSFFFDDTTGPRARRAAESYLRTAARPVAKRRRR